MKNLTLDQLTAMGFRVTLNYHNAEVSEAVAELQGQCASIVTTAYSDETSCTGFAYTHQAGKSNLNGQNIEVNLYISGGFAK